MYRFEIVRIEHYNLFFKSCPVHVFNFSFQWIYTCMHKFEHVFSFNNNLQVINKHALAIKCYNSFVLAMFGSLIQSSLSGLASLFI